MVGRRLGVLHWYHLVYVCMLLEVLGTEDDVWFVVSELPVPYPLAAMRLSEGRQRFDVGEEKALCERIQDTPLTSLNGCIAVL